MIDQAGAIRIPDDVPFEVAAIAGCAVITGVGAVVNTAQVRPGSSAAIIGCGGVGLSAILGCQLVGCQTIIAVDVVAKKLEFARQIGATDTINARVETRSRRCAHAPTVAPNTSSMLSDRRRPSHRR